MPQRNYLISTTSLSLTPSGTTIGSGNTTSATFAVARTMIRTGIGSGELASGSRTWSIHYVVSAMTTPYEMRLKLQRLNSSGVMQTESSYGAVQSTTGTFDDNITWDSGTWAANDQLAVVWEYRRPSGTGNKNGTIDANGASYVDAALPIVVTTVTPSAASLASTLLASLLRLTITPTVGALSTTRFAPSLRTIVTPTTAAITTTQFASSLHVRVTPASQSLTATRFAPALRWDVVPSTSSLNVTTFAPTVGTDIIPDSSSLVVSPFAPSVSLTDNVTVVVGTASLTLSTASPHILPARIIFLDPGGDAVQVTGYFNTVVANGAQISFDSAQQVVGVGSWKFDSGAGNVATIVSVNGVLGAERRVSFYFRYDDVPDTAATGSMFVTGWEIYSGGGFTDPNVLDLDDSQYATATPARNDGQGLVFSSLGFDAAIPVSAIIDSVKIIYERSYDVGTSIGISRVKWRVNGEEGPNHDDTNMPLTDTVVEVDVTGDRGWTREDLLDPVLVGEVEVPVFEVIAEARRGDTDTSHTQSWDYVKVEVEYHLPVAIWSANDASNGEMVQLSAFQRGSGVSLRLASTSSVGVFNSFDGITELAPDTWHRVSLTFIENGFTGDDLDIKLFVNSILELDLVTIATGGFTATANMRYGWLSPPGANRVIWFDQFYIDDGMDMEDPGNIRSTAKLPATVNNDNFDTTGGTGAVNERPVNLDNYRQQAATAQLSQDYTIQAASVGDIDLSSQTLVGHMGWIVAKKSGIGQVFGLILNGSINTISITTVPSLYRRAITDANYPSNVAGIGMQSSTGSNDSFLYECGIVVAYRPTMVNPNSLLSYQVLANGSTTNLTDDLRSDPQTSYELCYRIDDGDANVLITIYSILSEGQPAQLQGICGGQGGYGRTRITPGIEVQVVLEVTGGSTGVSVWRRVNIA